GAIADMTLEKLRALKTRDGEAIPTFPAVIQLAKDLSAGLYVELKGEGTGPASLRDLDEAGFDNAIIGSFNRDRIRALHEGGCRFPLSVLVPWGEDPFEAARKSRARIIHLCWESASDRPQDLVTPDLLDRARREGLEIVLWHEERPDVLADILKLPVLGICGNRPELLAGAVSPAAT
ncbi:MAG: glycerophosphodiester phosphodiesterase, partial [Rhodospirillales bacterium]|nr:glycerophosphodiester phosphodiesterase [Rhodospirillales bacterium]